jgi:hypothetical protein
MKLKAYFHKLEMEALSQAKIYGSQTKLSNTQLSSSTAPTPKRIPIWKKFRGKSTFYPPNTEDVLESFCKQVKLETLKSPLKPIRWSNMTQEERDGIDLLSKNPEITIKKADKGSAIVVMNTVDYIAEANRQLNDKNSYINLPSDPTESVCKEIHWYLTLCIQ